MKRTMIELKDAATNAEVLLDPHAIVALSTVIEPGRPLHTIVCINGHAFRVSESIKDIHALAKAADEYDATAQCSANAGQVGAGAA